MTAKEYEDKNRGYAMFVTIVFGIFVGLATYNAAAGAAAIGGAFLIDLWLGHLVCAISGIMDKGEE